MIIYKEELTKRFLKGNNKLNKILGLLFRGGMGLIYRNEKDVAEVINNKSIILSEIEDPNKVNDTFFKILVQSISNLTLSHNDLVGLSSFILSQVYSLLVKYSEAGIHRLELEKSVKEVTGILHGILENNTIEFDGSYIDILCQNYSGSNIIDYFIKALEITPDHSSIVMEESYSDKWVVSNVDNMRISGNLVPISLFWDKGTFKIPEAQTLITDIPITKPSQIAYLLNCFSDNTPIILFSEYISEKCQRYIEDLIKMDRSVVGFEVLSLDSREILEDIAEITGAKFFNKTMGMTLEKATPNDFGFIEKVKIDRHNLWCSNKTLLATKYLEYLKTYKSFDKNRISRLSGVTSLFVGGFTDKEKKFNKQEMEKIFFRFENSLKEGIVKNFISNILSFDTNSIQSPITRSLLIEPFRELEKYLTEHQGELRETIDPLLSLGDALEVAYSTAKMLNSVEVGVY